MVRLRFVEEYRGQRIVSNGKLDGVQGELITDCRYLNVLGARTAIDSEAGIERRKKYLEWRRHVTPHAEYFGDYKTRAFTCECGWRGAFDALAKETFRRGEAVVPSMRPPSSSRHVPLGRGHQKRRRG